MEKNISKNKNHKKKVKDKSSSKYMIYYQHIGDYGIDIKEEKYNIETFKNIMNMSDIRYYSIFKKKYLPLYENDYFINGGSYKCIIQYYDFEKMDILIFIDTFIKLLNQYDFFKGIYFLHKRNEMKIQFWCNQDYDTSFFSTLKDKINTFFKKMIKPLEFLLFFPPPLSDAPDLSIIKMRNKKVYLLRFGTIMTNFFYVKKIWWEVELFDYFKKYYIPHTNMIDIGANVGTHSLLMSEIISNDSMIYAFEPVYWDVTMKNIYENNLQNKICLFTQGLGNSNKIIEVPVMDRMKPENFGRMSLIKDVTQKSKIKKKIGVITLDSLNLTNISVIKIDVEGMEREVLEGGKKTISENLPAIIIEIWPEEMDSFVNSDIGKYLLNECKYEIVPILTTGSNHDYILVSKNKKYINPGNL